MEIKDSGNRTQFESGAVRDLEKGKGRCDLLPIDIVANLIGRVPDDTLIHKAGSNKNCESILKYIYCAVFYGTTDCLYTMLIKFSEYRSTTTYDDILEVSKHYEQGAEKYGERNWEKGIPLKSYIDSAIRHLLKYYRGDTDEPHDRAFIWNILGYLWTIEHIAKLESGSRPIETI